MATPASAAPASAAPRHCKSCDVTKTNGDFEKGRAICKTCRAKQHKEWVRKVPAMDPAALPVAMICARCEAEKPLSAFEMTPSGPRAECKPCRALKRKESAAAAPKVDSATVSKPEACATCGKGEPEVIFKWRTDVKAGGWRSVCNSCYGAKMYHVASRDKRRAEDEEAFLKRNAEVAAGWRERNPEAVKEQQALQETLPERKIKTIVATANRRGEGIVDEDVEMMMDKLTESCHFCAYLPPPGEALNSLCRTNADKTYSNETTVAACRACVALKHTMPPGLFVAQARRVVENLGLGLPVEGVERPRPFTFGATEARRAAPAKQKRDELTSEQRWELMSQACYMCGQSPSFGVDRLDSAGDYTLANARPCCMDCNYIKKDFPLDSVLAHLAHIAAHTRGWDLGDVEAAPMLSLTSKPRQPISTVVRLADGRETKLVIPFIGLCGDILGVTKQAVFQSLVAGQRCRGVTFAYATPSDYRKQRLAPAVAREALLALLRASN